MTLRSRRPLPQAQVGSVSPKNMKIWGEVDANDYSVRKEGWKWGPGERITFAHFLRYSCISVLKV